MGSKHLLGEGVIWSRGLLDEEGLGHYRETDRVRAEGMVGAMEVKWVVRGMGARRTVGEGGPGVMRDCSEVWGLR